MSFSFFLLSFCKSAFMEKNVEYCNFRHRHGKAKAFYRKAKYTIAVFIRIMRVCSSEIMLIKCVWLKDDQGV